VREILAHVRVRSGVPERSVAVSGQRVTCRRLGCGLDGSHRPPTVVASVGSPMTWSAQFTVAANKEIDLRDALTARRGRAEGAITRKTARFDAR
jgi:hypothetical protein